MHISAYTSRLPNGLTTYTPLTQLGVEQSPNLAGSFNNRRSLKGMGDATTAATGAVNSALDTAKKLISDNPVPVLFLIGALLLK